VKDELRLAIAQFVGECARFCIAKPGDVPRRRFELHASFVALTEAWERWAP
jgi:hypothetical protein